MAEEKNSIKVYYPGSPLSICSGMTHSLQMGCLAWLAVRIWFDGQPLEDVEVEFFEESDPGQRGSAVGEKTVTDEDGFAAVAQKVPPGSYICAIEYQPDAVMTTTADPEQPVRLMLPIGSSSFRLHEDPFLSA